MEIQFFIHGNNHDPYGNAVPKLKMTGKQQWTPKAQNYQRWKNHVVEAFEKSRRTYPLPEDFKPKPKTVLRLGRRGMKPLDISDEYTVRMDLVIAWKNGQHGDPENIFGSIADALFVNDKNLNGSFEAQKSSDGFGKVCVVIRILKK
jgi:hypothetical protein